MVILSKPPYHSYNQFILSLKAHEQSLQLEAEVNNNQPNHEQAFYGQRGRGRGHEGCFNSSGRGFGPAINQNQRPFKGKTEGNQTNNFSNKKDDTMVCQIYGKRNHTAIRCWSRFNHSVQPEDELPQALTALRINDDLDPTLYADSGATTNIMNHTGKISNLTPYYGKDSLYVGDGNSLDITHVGEGHVKTKESSLKLNNILIVPKINIYGTLLLFFLMHT